MCMDKDKTIKFIIITRSPYLKVGCNLRVHFDSRSTHHIEVHFSAMVLMTS
jgi:hypothetical protein